MSRFRRLASLAVCLVSLGCSVPTESDDPLVPISNLTLRPYIISVVVGGTVSVESIFTGFGGSNLQGHVSSWTSADTTIATVDRFGRVTGRKKGNSLITARADNLIAYAMATVQ